MLDLVYSEFLKLKRSKFIFCFILISIVFPVFWLLITPFNIQKQTWLIYTSNAEDIMFMGIEILVSVFITSYIFVQEYSHGTVKLLYSFPISKFSIFIGKLFTIYLFIAITYFIYFIIVFGGGIIVIDEPLTQSFLTLHVRAYFCSMILDFALVPLLIFLIHLFKKSTVSAIIAILILISNFCIYELGLYYCWPFLLPYIPIMNLYGIHNMIDTAVLGIVTFISGILLCIFQLSNIKNV